MVLKLKNPLAFLDLETTGVDVIRDRIVEICIVKLMPSGERIVKTRRVNPTIPIPLEASLIHGIYDQDVAEEPTFRNVARSLSQFLEGCDLAGFNIVRFDLPMLVEEFLRADVPFSTEQRRVVDVQKIFHLMEPRTLSAAYQFYCGRELVNAHSAEADTLATLDVLEAQVARYQNKKIKDKSGKEYEPVTGEVASLHELSMSKIVDWAGRMTYNEKGDIVFNFGKHKGRTVKQVLKDEPTYYDWMMNGDFPLNTKQKLTEIRLREAKFNQ